MFANGVENIPLDEVPHLYGGEMAATPLNIIVVGAGLGGLSAVHTLAQSGHKVTLLEAAPKLGDVGAGIQVSPNASRLLIRWGLKSALESSAVKPHAIVFNRYNTGERVGYTRWGELMDEQYGAPYLHIHRADYHAMLLRLAKAAPGVTVRLGAFVRDVQPDPTAEGGPSVTLASGEVIHADLIVGADGVKSRIQSIVTGQAPEDPEPTGDCAYRATIPTEILLKDPELKPLVDEPNMMAWMAPGRHLMAYNIRSMQEYNMVLLLPDDGSVESWDVEGSADKMRADFGDFEPRVQKLLSFVTSTLKWRLMGRKPLPTWVHPAGRVVLLGDSCHPMLPYRAQGAAMAVEDAGVLGALLQKVSHVDQLPTLLKAYQELRFDRCTETQRSSRLNREIFHLEDGPEQEARDASMRIGMAGEAVYPAPARLPESSLDGNANQWADRTKSIAQFGYDADKEVDSWWAEHHQEVLAIGSEQARL
ncbi:FAD/NAD-P-binding domain-containing protein [Peniophora sp. CONT]|nr:FAD/NAD-P-binding domain-containing protein [Peniophora sp. CONT]